MRVIAGSARSLPLKTVPSDETRPTTDRIKETLFNMLNPYIPACRFLDLFAGSGAIGIEALSRGASFAAFSDTSKKAQKCIQENLAFTHLEDKALLLCTDALGAVTRLESMKEAPFDIVFMDPPYEQGLETLLLERLSSSPLITEDTVIVTEASIRTDLKNAEELGYEIIKDKVYKSNHHIWLRKRT